LVGCVNQPRDRSSHANKIIVANFNKNSPFFQTEGTLKVRGSIEMDEVEP
jgi:hypothetical protein